LKILHVTPSYYPAIQFGGPIQSVHLLNKELVAQGVEVHVFTTNAGLERSYLSTDWQEVDGVRIRYFPYFGYIHYNFSPALWKALFKQVRHYDLVHITAIWNFPVLAASLACQRYHVPYLISPRGTIYPETIALGSTFFKKVYYTVLAKGYLNRAAAIHFTAADEQDKVVRYLGLTNPSFVIPNGIQLQAFENVQTLPSFAHFHPGVAGHPYLLFLSRISQKKGLDMLIPAFAKLINDFPHYRLVIAGPDEEGYRIKVENMITKAGIEDSVIFTGMIEGPSKLAAYRDAKMFVLPSYSENFGMSVVEAMACGTPVIISDQVGIAPDVLTNQAGIVTQTSVESIMAGIHQLLTQPTRCQEIAVKGRKMVFEQYRIETVAQAFRKIYQQLQC
jgi:glycosyltransferase involved in cell wall biosynthesis